MKGPDRRALLLLSLTLVFATSIAAAAPTDDSPKADSQTQADTEEDDDTQEFVITATRVKTPSRQVASSTTVISEQQIDNRKSSSVAEALRGTPGLDVVRNGGPGGTTSVFLRGAKSEHTLVMLDGIELNDPISPGRAFNLADLTIDNVQQIEVVRGPQSILHGSDAIGGVINVITKKGAGEPKWFVSAEAGSYPTIRERVGVTGGTEKVNYSFGASRHDTEGISAASVRDGNTERDPYENTSVSGRLGFTPSNDSEISVLFRYSDTHADIDNGGGPGTDDPNHLLSTEQLFLRAQGEFTTCNDRFEHTVGFSFADTERTDRNDPDAADPLSILRSSFDGETRKFDWQGNFFAGDEHTLTIGAETEQDEGSSRFSSDGAWGPFESIFTKKTARTTGVFVQDQINISDRFFATAGVRFDDHSRFGSEVTYRVAPAYICPRWGTKIRGTLGTGFKAPTLYQLFSDVGDPTLEPETSTGWDVGIEQQVCGGKWILGATYFANDLNNLIDFDAITSTYMNTSSAKTSGIEFSASGQAGENVDINGSYTFTETKDEATGQKLVRRPKHKAAVDLNYRIQEDRQINFSILHVGGREDFDFSTFPAGRVTLGSYTLVNLGISQGIAEDSRLFARVENLLDENYEEVKGFGTPGISVFIGLRKSYR